MAIKLIQTNFTAGVLDPLLIGREDSNFFFNALADANDILVLPQGGVRRRPAMQYVRPLMRELAEISLAGVTVTAPQGGTPANIHDDDPETLLTTTSDLAAINPFVVARVAFAAPVAVDAVDVIDYSLSSGALDDEFFIQYSTDDATWLNWGAAFNWDAAPRSRRLRHGSTITARYWRLVRIGATNLASKASVGELRFWAQTAELAAGARLAPFAYSTDEAYMMVCTGGHIDVLVGSELTGAIAIPHASSQVPIMNWAQTLDTMILYHPDVAPQRIFRQGGDDEFDFGAVVFENIPEFDFGAGVGGTDEVQTLNDGATIVSGNRFTLLLEGYRTTAITAGATRADTAAAMQLALRALENTSATGITVVDATSGFTVTFGGDDGKQPWGEIKVGVLSGNSLWDTARTVRGKLPGEPIMSDARGWPRCGTIHQQRHYMGGFKSIPNAFTASFLADFYNLDIEIDDPAKALLFRPDTDQVGAIYQIVSGRHLSLFANDGEFYLPTEPIDESAVVKLTTRSGSKEGMRVYEVDGALLFIQGVKGEIEDREIATSVREFLFVDTEQSYMANPVSKLSSNQIKNPVDNSLRKAVNTDESDILLMVNEDGTGTAYTVLRNELVNAFMPISLRAGDKMLAVGVDKKRRVFFVTRRMIDGQPVQYIERWNDDLLLDCGGVIDLTFQKFKATPGQTVFTWTFDSPPSAEQIGVRIDDGRIDGYAVDLGAKTVTIDGGVDAGSIVRLSVMQKTVTGISHLEGEAIQTFIDGSPGETYTVQDGAITLNEYADTQIQYGFGLNVYGKLMPARIPGQQTLAGDKIRVIRLILSLFETGDLEVRVNGGQWRDVPLVRMDSNVLDYSLKELLVTGDVVMGGLLGWSMDGVVEFRQVPERPAPLTIRAITREVSV